MEFLNYYKRQSTQAILMQMQQQGQLGSVYVQPGTCIDCGIPMAQYEMFPRGRASRSLCQPHYAMRTSTSPYVCILCGGQNPAHQVQAVQRYPREVFNRLCSDRCKAIWAYMCHLASGGQRFQALPLHSGQSGTMHVPLPVQRVQPQAQQTQYVPLPEASQGYPHQVPHAQHVPMPGDGQEYPAQEMQQHPQPQHIVVNNQYNYTINVTEGYQEQAPTSRRVVQVVRDEPLALPEPEEYLTVDALFRELEKVPSCPSYDDD